MAKLGELFSKQFEELKLQVGVVVPANGKPTPRELKSEDLILVGPPRVSPQRAVSTLDESQLVGELLEWLEREGFILSVERHARKLEVRKYSNRLDIQQAFFAERDT